jgi:N utilization substance protein A
MPTFLFVWEMPRRGDGREGQETPGSRGKVRHVNSNLFEVLKQIEREKDIPLDTLVDTIQQALLSAYKKRYGAGGNVRVQLDQKTGEFRVYAQKQVVERSTNPYTEISWRDAQAVKPQINLGETLEVEATPTDFGRIAAQTAKQVVLQRIREAERESVFQEFAGRESELVTGDVQRKERRNVFINLGRVEALLPPSEQVPNEFYRFGDRLKIYVLEVRKTSKTPQVIVSRTHPGLVRRLFELEVPEIREGTVEIKSVAREAGQRTKIAVHSRDPNVDPVGACVGQRGLRVQAVVDELSGEKIDIVRWNEDPVQFLTNALSPAQVAQVLLHPDNKTATVIVNEDQQSLAIGKMGQNVRLAARLTGWRIDIRTQAQYDEELKKQTTSDAVAAEEVGVVETTE